ncbi:MAG: lipid-A-disaccharide synthase, partial [Pontibacterium sp.]
MDATLRIAIVAGEASGDILGAGLMRELKQRLPSVSFEGIGGELMIEEGCESFYPLERLSVMGLVEVLGRLKELIGIRKSLIQRWVDDPPDIF